jgi:hypothetical protein
MTRGTRTAELLEAVEDVALPMSAPPLQSFDNSTAEHRARFEKYRVQLHAARHTADDWWQGLIDSETRRTGDRKQARINIETRRPYGAAVHPAVIHCLRAAWLDCQLINDRLPQMSQVAPQAFVMLWLSEVGEQDLADFVATLPFWPVGQDEAGRWV